MHPADAMSNSDFWEAKYAAGHEQRYPWDRVVSFVFRNIPLNLAKNELKILEIGFGTGGNLWFAAREGFSVSGVEQSEAAVAVAQKRFKEDRLDGDLRIGDFSSLPFEDNSFDLAIDRASLACVNQKTAMQSIREVHRCLKAGGKFLSEGYGSEHTSARFGQKSVNGMTVNITAGALVGAGDIRFMSKADAFKLFPKGDWRIEKVERLDKSNFMDADCALEQQWLITAVSEKK